jgi:hypothetical protein
MFSIRSVGECPECRHSPGCEEERPSALADARRSEGTIADVPVRCLSVEMQFRGHTGYELPERQTPDLELLPERLGAARTGSPRTGHFASRRQDTAIVAWRASRCALGCCPAERFVSSAGGRGDTGEGRRCCERPAVLCA